jgi:hypothetical protein
VIDGAIQTPFELLLLEILKPSENTEEYQERTTIMKQ